MLRLLKHRHEATLFEQDELRLPNGDYVPDAPAKLREFWMNRGLDMNFEHTQMGDRLLVKHMLCVEDVS